MSLLFLIATMSASSGHMIMPMSPCKITASVDDRRKTNWWRDYSALGDLAAIGHSRPRRKITPLLYACSTPLLRCNCRGPENDTARQWEDLITVCVRHGCNLTSIDTNYSHNLARPGSNSEAALPSLRGPIRTYLESCL